MRKPALILALVSSLFISQGSNAAPFGSAGEVVAVSDGHATVLLTETGAEINPGDWVAVYKMIDGVEVELARGNALQVIDGSISAEINSARLEIGQKARATPRAPMHAADSVASLPDDPIGLVDGIANEKLDVAAALKACAEALEEFPYESRFHAQIGRAYELDNKPGSAILSYQAALERNPSYAVVLHRLASLRFYGPEELVEHETARKLFKRAAELKYLASMPVLGAMCRDGQGGVRDFEAAYKWFTLSAESGDRYAQNALGECFERAWGVKQDIGKALLWYRTSAERDFPAAMYNLGRVFEHGIGVEQNDKKAFEWYGKAGAKDDANGLFELAMFYKAGRGTLANFDNAFEALTMSAQRGNPKAMRVLGSYYFIGDGVKKDYGQAALWYTKSAALGDAQAQYELAAMMEKGYGVGRDKQHAITLYRDAAKQGHNSSQKRLLALKEDW